MRALQRKKRSYIFVPLNKKHMQTNRIVKLIVLFLLQSAAIADDLYLKNGLLYTNVLVLDTTGVTIYFVRDSVTISIGSELIEKIEKKDVIPNLRSTREIYSQSKYDEFRLLNQQIALLHDKEKNRPVEDSVAKVNQRLDRLQPWRSSVFMAIGYGTPQGMRCELGYNIGSKLSMAFTFGIGDQWSRDPQEGMPGVSLTIRIPNFNSAAAPYVSIMRGTTLTIFGGPDSYTQLCFGFITPLASAFQLRPEIGVAFTSRHVSGGTSLFGGTTPEVYNERTLFYIHVALEIDFRQF